MKFKLSDATPQTVSRTLPRTTPTGVRIMESELFDKAKVYDTKDFVDKYPSFAESVLDIRIKKSRVKKPEVQQLRQIYGETLQASTCSACGGVNYEVSYPLFEEVKP